MSKDLSLDAKSLLGSVFLFRHTTLVYQMIESRPPQRLQNALDELLAAEMIERTFGEARVDGSRSVSYRACVSTRDYVRFANKVKDLYLSEPIPR